MIMRLTSESLYFRDINRYRILTDKEERELVRKVQRREPGAHDALITANLRFVVSVARGYRGRGVSFLDLIDEGNIGLIKAAERFNLYMKVKFISYAVVDPPVHPEGAVRADGARPSPLQQDFAHPQFQEGAGPQPGRLLRNRHHEQVQTA
jgi:hypothetical protein